MSRQYYRLIYYSTNRTDPASDMLRPVVEQILTASRRNNARVGVTGALMFNAGCFAQVLEGPEDAVTHTFERIQQDERHGDVSVLSFGPVDHLVFDRWSMAFVGTSAQHEAAFQGIGDASGFNPSQMAGDEIFERLRRLVLEEESAHP